MKTPPPGKLKVRSFLLKSHFVRLRKNRVGRHRQVDFRLAAKNYVRFVKFDHGTKLGFFICTLESITVQRKNFDLMTWHVRTTSSKFRLGAGSKQW